LFDHVDATKPPAHSMDDLFMGAFGVCSGFN
jgi:hypothetical protein